LHGAVEPALPVLTQATGLQGAGMHVDAAVQWMLLGVESPRVSSVAHLIS
jgi:hypothetical protein